MIQASSAITYIQTELNKLKSSGQLSGKIRRSKTTLSLYLNTRKPSPDPQKTARISNHHPKMQHMAQGSNQPWNTVNIGIEFYEPVVLPNGKIKKNRFYTNVLQNASGTVQPFSIIVYEYRASLLDYSDIPQIFQALISFITTQKYIDPLKGTTKAAKEIPRTAKIIPRKTGKATSSAVSQTSNRIPSFTQSVTQQSTFSPPTITESQLRQIIRETIVNAIYG